MFVTSVLIFLVVIVYANGENQQPLADTIIPLHYDIALEPKFSDLNFGGTTVIKVQVLETVENITLHAKNLNVTEIKVLDVQSSEITDIELTLYPEFDTAVISFFGSLPAGLYDLKFTYVGQINENYEGLYISKYTTDKERQIALTNFQFAKARQVFPCFDHPAFPATFSLSIIRTNDYTTLSNMGIKSQQLLSDYSTLDTFAKSDMMPTYLVAFAIIDFKKVANENISLYSVVNEGTDLMIQLALQVWEKFTDLYPYKLNKIDYVIVPDNSLSRDVFENVGLVIYRQSAVLYDPQKQTTKKKQSILKLIAHAVAKQSYKNLNTSQWWSHFWLNEGIISLYQYEIMTQLKPDWQLLEQFVVEDLHTALQYDTEITLAIDNDEAPDSLSEFFYTKAFSLVRTVFNLKLPGDITDIADHYIASSWVKATSYPILTGNANYETSTITISQDPSNFWPIPFNMATKDQQDFDNTVFTHNLNATKEDFSLSLKPDSWYIVNKKQIGYFRVGYEDNNWALLINYLRFDNFTTINRINRAQLIDDAYNLAKMNWMDYEPYLELIKYITNEEDFIPLYTFFKTTSELKSLLAKTETQPKFLNFVKNITDHLYDMVGTEIKSTDTDIERLNRINVLSWLCNFGNEICQNAMFEILSRNETVDPDIAEPVYCGGMRMSDIENFMFLFNQYKTSGNANILKSMGCTSNTDLLTHILQGTIDKSMIIQLNREDRVKAFYAVFEGSEQGVDAALQFIKQNLETILNLFSEDEISDILIALSKKLTTTEENATIDEIILCFTEEEKVKYEKLFEQVKNNVNINVQWKSDYLSRIDDWLSSLTTTTTISTTTISTTSTTSTTSTASTTTASTTTANTTSSTTTTSSTPPTPTSEVTTTTDSSSSAITFKNELHFLNFLLCILMYFALFYN